MTLSLLQSKWMKSPVTCCSFEVFFYWIARRIALPKSWADAGFAPRITRRNAQRRGEERRIENEHWPSTVTCVPQAFSFFSYFPPSSFRRVSTRKGTALVNFIASSSSLLNEVTRRPLTIDWPFSSLTFTKDTVPRKFVRLLLRKAFYWPMAAGPWQTAETTLPCFQNCSATRILSWSVGRSKHGPWPPM